MNMWVWLRHLMPQGISLTTRNRGEMGCKRSRLCQASHTFLRDRVLAAVDDCLPGQANPRSDPDWEFPCSNCPGLASGCRMAQTGARFWTCWPALPVSFLAGDICEETSGLDPKSTDVSGNTPVDISGAWIHAYVPVLYFRLQSVRGDKVSLLLTDFSTSLKGLASSAIVKLRMQSTEQFGGQAQTQSTLCTFFLPCWTLARLQLRF